MKSKRKARGYPNYSLHQVQKAFVTALSRPKWITEKFPLNQEYKDEHFVKRAALTAKCPKRTKTFLSVPRPQNKYKKLEDGWQFKVRRAALKCEPTPWNIVSSIPKMQISLLNKKRYAPVLKRKQKMVLNRNYNLARSIFNQQHPPEEEKNNGIMSGAPIHLKCFDEVIHAKKAGLICQVSQKERKNFMLRMVRLGQPKPKQKPPRPQRGPKKPMKELNKRLVKLIVPKHRRDKEKPDPYKVKESALNHQISERTAELARHKEVPPPPPVYDFRGREILPPRVWDIAARQKVIGQISLRMKLRILRTRWEVQKLKQFLFIFDENHVGGKLVLASERTCELSIPKRVKKKAAVDAKDDPYVISQAALNATPSERIIELAKPIIRD